jgi:lipopolysaccharide transport system permease protein
MVLDLTARPQSARSMLAAFWRSRDLAFSLARRDFFSRYRRTSLGAIWAIAMPLMQAGVMALVFTRVARLSLPGNAFVFTYAGMAGWSFFASGIGTSSTAIVDNSSLASRIYFPRLVLPLVSVLSGVYLLIFNFLLLLVVAFATGTDLSVYVLLVPLGMCMALLTTVLAAAVLAGIHVYFRDTKYLVQAILLLAVYVTPSFYPLTRAPSKLRIFAELNPMTGPIELTRRGIGMSDPNWLTTVGINAIWVVAMLVAAVWIYRRFDRLFSDLM